MTITKEQRVPRGRPKVLDFKTKQEYFRHYYQNNRDKWNHDFFCNTCELYSSFANKSRHNKSKFHLAKAKAKAQNEVKEEAKIEAQNEVKEDATEVLSPQVLSTEGLSTEVLSEEKLEIKLELFLSDDIVA